MGSVRCQRDDRDRRPFAKPRRRAYPSWGTRPSSAGRAAQGPFPGRPFPKRQSTVISIPVGMVAVAIFVSRIVGTANSLAKEAICPATLPTSVRMALGLFHRQHKLGRRMFGHEDRPFRKIHQIFLGLNLKSRSAADPRVGHGALFYEQRIIGDAQGSIGCRIPTTPREEGGIEGAKAARPGPGPTRCPGDAYNVFPMPGRIRQGC